MPPKRKINQRVLGAEHPRVEEWDTYYRYVGPQQQPRPKSKAAAPAPAGGAAGTGAPPCCSSSGTPVPKEPKTARSSATYTWQPSLRGLDHPAQPASTGPKVTVSVRKVPQPPKSGSQGVAAFGRDTAVPVASSPARPPAKARPKAPEPKAAETLADRIRNLPPPPPGVAMSSATRTRARVAYPLSIRTADAHARNFRHFLGLRGSELTTLTFIKMDEAGELEQAAHAP